MTRRFARSARALSVLTLAATTALSTAQTAPSTQPATQPATAPATEASTLPSTTQAVATTTSTTMPATTQAVATTGPATRSTAVGPPVSQPAQRIGFQFDKTPVKQVLEYLSQKAGFSIDEETPVEGDISIINRSEVTSAEAVTMLNAALKRKGFAAIQQGTKLRIVKWGDAKKQNIPVRYGADPEMVPETDELVTWVIPVKNVDAAKLRTDLALLISSDADFTSNQGSNSLIMTDTCASIRRIVAIVAKLDQQPALSSSILTRRLSFANASAAAKLVMAIFGPDQNQNQPGGPGGGGPGRFFRAMLQQGGGAPGGPGGQDTGKTSGKLTAAADDRTNTIVVTGPPDTLRVIDGILTTLDSDPVELSKVEVFSLEFADATSAAKLINTLFQPEATGGGGGGGGGRGGGGDGGGGGGRTAAIEGLSAEDRNVRVNAAAADRTNTLVVTAPPGTMKLITQILKALDADPAARSEVKVFQLKYADSASAAKLIASIFQSDQSQQQQQPQAPGGAAGTHLPAIGGLSTSLHGGRVNAVSDDRTNTLVVTAPSDAMLIVTGILEKLDSNPSAESALFIYHLRNGVASDIQATLSALFSSGATGGGSASNSNSNSNRNSGQSLQGSGFGSNSGFGSSGSGRSGLGGGSSGSSGGFGSPLTSATNTQRPTGTSGGGAAASGTSIRATSELIGQVIVVADNDTNSLLVSTANRYKEQVQKIIQELDRPVPQVLIKVLIAEVTHDRSDDAGIDFSVLNTRPSGKGWQLGQQLGNAAAGTANGGLVVSLMESNLNATLHALSIEGKLDVLSRPYILASDNQPAAITIGQEVPFITNTQITETGQQINTITYQAVGIILNVTPHINPDGAVTLDVAPEISAISATTVPIGNGINAPVIDNRSAQSRVTIRNGNTIVIGGMMQDQKTTTISKIPLLGDIPYIGAFFTRYQNTRSKTELLIFLTPHLAQQPEALRGMSEDEMKGTKITPVDPSTFQGHIDGLHLGATTQGATSQPSIIDIKPTPSTQPFNGIIIAPASPYKNRTPIGP